MVKFYQEPGDPNLKRTLHVWVRRTAKDGGYKCVLCGGVSWQPADDTVCRFHERLTPAERALCPAPTGPPAIPPPPGPAEGIQGKGGRPPPGAGKPKKGKG